MGFMDTLRKWFGAAKDKASDVADMAGDRAGGAFEKAKDLAGDVADKAKDVVGDVKDRFDGGDAAKTVGDAAEGVADEMHEG